MTRAVTHESLFNALVAVDEARSTTPLSPEQRLDRLLAALTPERTPPPTAANASPPAPPPEPHIDPAAPAPSLFERVRGLLHDYESLLARYHDDFDRLFDGARVDPAAAGLLPAEPGGDEALLARLRRAQLLLLKYPVAVQAALSALVAEGRRFAATPEGARMQTALADSELVRGGRAVWDAMSLRALADDPPTALPSAYLDAFLQAARAPELEALLARLFTDRPQP